MNKCPQGHFPVDIHVHRQCPPDSLALPLNKLQGNRKNPILRMPLLTAQRNQLNHFQLLPFDGIIQQIGDTKIRQLQNPVGINEHILQAEHPMVANGGLNNFAFISNWH